MSREGAARLWRPRPLPLSLPLVLVLPLVLLAPAARGDDAAERARSLRDQAQQREQRAEGLAQEAEVSLAGLETLDRKLTQARAELRGLRERCDAAKARADRAEEELERGDEMLAQVAQELRRRLVALYKFEAVGGQGTAFRAADVQRALYVNAGLARVAERDAELFARYRATRGERQARAERAERALGELERTKLVLAQREGALRHESVERRNLVALLRSRASRERQAADDLRDAAERLERALLELPKGSPTPSGPGLARGQVARPVLGPVRQGFGRAVDPEFGTETVRNGIEIQAERGTQVRAVAEGKVLFAGWFRGYGQVVIVDHGSANITVSGFLDEIQVKAGQAVQPGAVIGLVGDTGSLSGPGLYFELRERGKPVDPQLWLE